MSGRPRVVAGRYRLDGPIGRGGMGQVWAATDERLGRPVAVKLLRGDLDASAGTLAGAPAGPVLADSAETADLRTRFLRECRTAAALDHPGIVTVYDAGQDGERLFLVMQRLDGIGLADLIDERGPLPVAWAAALAAQLAGALSAVHAAGVVHRDVKPNNVILRPDGRAVLLDLGIAAAFEPELSRLTRSGTPVGTPTYMAPEQAATGAIEPRGDLYALGCVLHALLLGDPPFTGGSALAVMHEHLVSAPRPVRELRPEVPAPLERLILDLLAKEPAGRPACAEEVYARLLPFLPASERSPEGLRAAGAGPGAGTGAAGADPTVPYRFPLGPVRVTGGGGTAAGPRFGPAFARPAAVTGAAVGPAAERAGGGDFVIGAPRAATGGGIRPADAAMRAAELYESGRSADAAGLLSAVLDDPAAHRELSADQSRALRRYRAELLMRDRQLAAAMAEFTALATDLVAERGASDPEALECGYLAAGCQARIGDAAGALAAYRGLLAIHQERLARGLDTDPERAERIRLHIGELLMTTRDLAGAWETLLTLLMELEPRLGPVHPRVREIRTLLDWIQPLRFGTR
ncbi:serine/threonine-protein kinase [Phaeacidiphilus oryzae]|uniref:serine/threonine-protein kinase n=1 Tax=Phaeacidiphilus oryzae TaxID=348818 RepID=UPI00055F014D|nr:serine/threonine-protein kinase [Phaeacidiphilus oryzae]